MRVDIDGALERLLRDPKHARTTGSPIMRIAV